MVSFRVPALPGHEYKETTHAAESAFCAGQPGRTGADSSWTELMPGKDLDAWRQPRGEWATASEVVLDTQDSKRLAWKPGTGPAVNGAKGTTVNLVSAKAFRDIKAHVEFMYRLTPILASTSWDATNSRFTTATESSRINIRHRCGGIYPHWWGTSSRAIRRGSMLPCRRKVANF